MSGITKTKSPRIGKTVDGVSKGGYIVLEMNLQLFGGRGASSGGGGGGGSTGGGSPLETTSLISDRERKPAEVDQTLTVMRDVYDRYGIDVSDARLATMDKRGQSTLAYYDSNGNLAFNQSYFDAQKMDKAYDECVKQGFHPPRGNKTGIEAVAAHELGHRLTEEVGRKQGRGDWKLDAASNDIVKEAAKAAGYGNKTREFRRKISGYGSQSNAEAVAEAFADVYCNGNKASKESRAVVNALNKYF